MKGLSIYLCESLLCEGNEGAIMLTSFDDQEGSNAKTWFEENKLVDKDGRIYCGRSKSIFITLNEIEELYKYATENNKPCPIIGNYKGVPGKFVFRRWVGSDPDAAEIFSNIDVTSEKGSPYMGLHNTNLREDGKWFPSAEDYESVISYAYNKVNNLFQDDFENILYVTGKPATPNSKSEQLMMYYAGNMESFNNIVSALPEDCGKMKKLPSEKTPDLKQWEEAGEYTSKINKTPKTDVISEKNYRISFKKSGGSQLMSGFECETRATLRLCAKNFSKTIQDKVETLFERPWSAKLTAQDSDKRSEGKQENRKLTSIIRELFDNKDFKWDVMYEAASGEMKFGKDSSSCAEYVFVWDDVKKSNNKFYTVKEYIDHVIPSADAIVAFKTAGKTSTSLRITTK